MFGLMTLDQGKLVKEKKKMITTQLDLSYHCINLEGEPFLVFLVFLV